MDADGSRSGRDILAEFARKYLWWGTPAAALRSPDRVIAQVMELGDFADVARAVDAFGERRLVAVIERSEPGWFSPKSWAYWHYRLHLTPYDRMPPPRPRRVLS